MKTMLVIVYTFIITLWAGFLITAILYGVRPQMWSEHVKGGFIAYMIISNILPMMARLFNPDDHN